jgi:alkanesulfonate monooxygenase SsuD/methylene tetrahydromethanopterin reductase-like flavin-dependent oxidoreductase (luciferase family)
MEEHDGTTTTIRDQDGAADTTYEEIVTVWKEADGIPVIEHAWLFDHFSPINGNLDGPCLEGWQTLAALAVRNEPRTPRFDGHGQHLSPSRRPDQIAITTDIISRGRLDFGIGAGWNDTSTPAWVSRSTHRVSASGSSMRRARYISLSARNTSRPMRADTIN